MSTLSASATATETGAVTWLSPAQLAAELQIPLQTIYVWRSMRKGPRGHKIGNHVRYSRADINAWLETTADEQR